jgi:hypothetical protein
MNITEEAQGLDKLLQQAQQQDKDKPVKPQEANPDIECFGCGS